MLCTLVTGEDVYAGVPLTGWESLPSHIDVRYGMDTHLVFENGDHVMVASIDPNVSKEYLLKVLHN
jgi:hypothetical protein